MPQLSTVSTDRIDVTVGRLRQVLSDFAELNSDLRRQFLADEINRALTGVEASDQQIPFLQELRGRYARAHPPARREPPATKPAAGELCDDATVIELLDATIVELTAVIERTSGHGPDGGMTEEQAVQELCTALNISGTSVDPVRAIAMATMLAQFSNSMTTLAWMAWRTIAPNSSVRRGGVSQKLFARYVAGDPAVSREQVAGELERLRQLIAALISAISQVGEQFARSHLDKFSPAEIEQAVVSENRGGLFKSREALCWRKYLQMAETLDQGAIESEVRRVLAEHAEHLMRGIGRS